MYFMIAENPRVPCLCDRLTALFTVLPLFLFFLNACAEKDVYAHLDSSANFTDKKIIVDAADWKDAITFEIKIRQNEFRPSIIRLRQGRPYIMLIENRDEVNHFMLAQEFFKTTAIRKILTKDSEITGVNLVGIYLDPGEIKEVHFIPIRDGWFDFEGGQGPGIFTTDNVFSPLSRGATQGMIGSFVIEE